MRLSGKTLRQLAEMICGAHGSGQGYSWPGFPYRTASRLVEFFEDCGIEVEAAGTRKDWVREVLDRLNLETAVHPDLPSDPLVDIIVELMSPRHFDPVSVGGDELDRAGALNALDQALRADGLGLVAKDDAVEIVARETGTRSRMQAAPRRALSEAEHRRWKRLGAHFDTLSEDEFTTNILVPVLRQLGFVSISVSGHRDKALEFGKDAWMKYRIPTGNWLYFGLQVKVGKVDASARSTSNVAEILNQVKMMLDHPVFDPESNRRHLLDHVFLVSSGAITKAARQWLGEHLDLQARRTLMFVDRDRMLEMAIASAAHLPGFDGDQAEVPNGDDFPF